MSEFYSKYRHLFEEGASDFSHFRNGYDQQAPIQQKYMQQPKVNYEQQQQQQQQQYPIFQQQQQPPPISQPLPKQQKQQYSPYKQTSPYQNKYTPPPHIQQQNPYQKKNDDDKFRKQVVQENIFYTQTPIQMQLKSEDQYQMPRKFANEESQPPPQLKINQKFQHQTYNAFAQEKDILDSIPIQKPKNTQIQQQEGEQNIHKIYLMRLTDIDYMKKRYVDQKQIVRDQDNQYKQALQNRVLAYIKIGDRRARLKEILKKQ